MKIIKIIFKIYLKSLEVLKYYLTKNLNLIKNYNSI